MYVHPAFHADPARVVELLRSRGFGTLVAHDGATPFAAHVPFLYHPGGEEGGGGGAGGVGRIELHVARANPIHEIVARQPRVLLTCLGPDAYVSPDWYASPNQVSTWTYTAVHVTGTARLMPREGMRGHLERLSAHFEAGLPKVPWTMDKLDPARLAALSNGIVGIDVDAETVTGQWKLNQHKAQADHEAVTAALRARRDGGRDAARAVADLMDAARRPPA